MKHAYTKRLLAYYLAVIALGSSFVSFDGKVRSKKGSDISQKVVTPVDKNNSPINLLTMDEAYEFYIKLKLNTNIDDVYFKNSDLLKALLQNADIDSLKNKQFIKAEEFFDTFYYTKDYSWFYSDKGLQFVQKKDGEYTKTTFTDDSAFGYYILSNEIRYTDGKNMNYNDVNRFGLSTNYESTDDYYFETIDHIDSKFKYMYGAKEYRFTGFHDKEHGDFDYYSYSVTIKPNGGAELHLFAYGSLENNVYDLSTSIDDPKGELAKEFIELFNKRDYKKLDNIVKELCKQKGNQKVYKKIK